MAQPSARAGNVKAMETNNYQQGRSGSKSKELPGPVKNVKHNPTKGGGIHRSTKSGSNY